MLWCCCLPGCGIWDREALYTSLAEYVLLFYLLLAMYIKYWQPDQASCHAGDERDRKNPSPPKSRPSLDAQKPDQSHMDMM